MLRHLAPLLCAASFACGPRGPSGDDEIGGTGSESGSETDTDSESESGTDSETETGTDSQTETETDTDSETETGTDSETETGDPPELCPLELDDPGGLWTLPCGPGCAELEWAGQHFFIVDAEGSQLPTQGLTCETHSIEGTVIDHPSPERWVIDACPCDLDCAALDPHVIDFAEPGEHPAPELLPVELGSCVRADIHTAKYLDSLCAARAIALWSLDDPEPRLLYAQGNHDVLFEGDTVELGPVLVAGAGEDCSDGDGSTFWSEYALRFELAGAEVVVPHQSLDTLFLPSGDYEARNVANVRFVSEINSRSPAFAMWSLRPL